MREVRIGLFLLLVALSTGCGKTIELNSMWRDREITIDGVDTEWEGNTTYIEKEKVAISLLNDESYVYIRLVSRNSDINRQVMMSGLTIWFGPEGGKKKEIGIRYPLGPEKMAMPMMERDRMEDQEERKEMFKRTMNEMEILSRDEKYRVALTGADTLGIGVKAGFSQGMIVYELKVSLNKDVDHPYGIGINTTALTTGKSVESINIGFETSGFDREKMIDRMEGGRPPGMEGGRPPAGGGRGRPPGGYGEEPKQLQLWVSVKLGIQPKSEE